MSDVICEMMFVILHTSVCQLKCEFLYSPAYNLVACSRYILDLFCANLGHYLFYADDITPGWAKSVRFFEAGRAVKNCLLV